eukprot:4652033-Ditylum_brightwellii.AAC.1
MQLKDFPGENVSTAASYLRGVIVLLKNCKEIPTDLMGLLNEIFASASTEDYSAYVNMLYINHCTSVKIITPLEFIEDAEKNIEGHCSYECSKPSTGNKFAPSEWKPGGGRECGGGRGQGGRSHDGGRGRGKERGGRSKSGKEHSFPQSGKKNRTPPKPGDYHKRKREGSNKFEYWCCWCGEWTNHNKGSSSCPNKPDSGANAAQTPEDEEAGGVAAIGSLVHSGLC